MILMKNVLELLRRIPQGKITTYKELSLIAGMHPRAVAMILKYNDDPIKYPCYKVVHANGEVGGYTAPGGVRTKIDKLKSDGIIIRKNKVVDLEKHLFRF